VTVSEITQADRASWQRRAVAELAVILDTHCDLPLIAWTVSPAASTLAGHVNGLAPGAKVRRVFEAWRMALTLTDHSEATSSSGTTYLRAAASRNRVRVRITATVFDDEGED
jgi:hypothetical protein